MPRTVTETCIQRHAPDVLHANAGSHAPGQASALAVDHVSTLVTPRTTRSPRAPKQRRKMFTENRRLRDELRTTHARIAALEAERTDYRRRARRAGVLPLDAFREAAVLALRGPQRRGEPAALVLVDI